MTIQVQFGQAVAEIAPLKANFSDPAPSIYVGCILTRDDLISSCDILCKLLGSDGSKYYESTITIGGNDYTAWEGDNDYCFTYVGAILGLTFV